MSVGIKINVNDFASDDLKRLIKGLTPTGLAEINQKAARGALTAIKSYHRGLDSQGGWFNTSLPTWGAGRNRTHWPRSLVRAWSVDRADANGVLIANDWPGYRLKVYGGVVTGKPVLRIPMDPRAHGRTPAQFERVTGLRLFRPKGRDVLMFVENRGGPPKTAYCYKKSVTHKKWPGALPPDETFVGPFIKVMAAELARDLDRLG